MRDVTGDDWSAIRDRLQDRDRSALPGSDLDLLADALFWTDDVDESMTARRAAYQAHAAAHDDAAAAMSAWRLFYDHFLVGELAVANGWRERCRRHVDASDDPLPAGWLALADADVAGRAGDDDDAIGHADRALATARRHDDPNLTAMALTAAGTTRIAVGTRSEGLGMLDEAMVAVVNDELSPLFTGWVYCNVVSTCYALADLRRASEWSDAALRWCATLRDGHMYPGLCRVYAAEVATVRGDWERAEREAVRACADLELFDERYAAEAWYLVGELSRHQGRADDARAAFARAHALGRDPLPGRALLTADEGDPEQALVTLKAAMATGGTLPLPRVLLLRAVIDVATAAGDADTVEAAAAEIGRIAAAHDSELLTAHALASEALTHPIGAEPHAALGLLRSAVGAFVAADAPVDAARLRRSLAAAYTAVGDPDAAALERRAANETLARLGIEPTPHPATARTSPLTDRERDVLRLVADGLTNPEIAAELVLSPHTIARHVSNIMTKFGVSTRAAAVAKAGPDDLAP